MVRSFDDFCSVMADQCCRQDRLSFSSSSREAGNCVGYVVCEDVKILKDEVSGDIYLIPDRPFLFKKIPFERRH